VSRPGEPARDDVVGGRERPARRRRPALLAVSLSALGVIAAVTAPTLVSSARSTAPVDAKTVAAAPPPPVPDPVCPPSTFPTRDPKGYAVQVKADINDIQLYNGWNEQTQNWQSVATNITAKACGILQVPSLQVVIQPSGLIFDTTKAKIETLIGTVPLFLPGEVGVLLTSTAPATTTITAVRPGDGRLDLAAQTTLRADVVNGPKNLSTFDCPTSPVTTLFTGRSSVVPPGRGPRGPVQPGRPDLPPWTVEGSPLDGPLVGATETVVSNDFPLPVFPASGTCSLFSSLFNPIFAGQTEGGETYYDQVTYGPVQPPGASQVIGNLVIREVDPSAVQVGPPPTVPGT